MKSEQIGNIGAFPKTRNVNRKKTGKSEQIRRNLCSFARKKNITPQNHNLDSRQLSEKLVPKDVPFRRCHKICRRVNAGTPPHCEHTSWMFLSWEVGGWISEGIRQTTWLENGKIFRWRTFMSFPAAERNTQTIFWGKWKQFSSGK